MANFFQLQEKAKKKTKLLILLYILSLASIILAIYFVFLLLFKSQASNFSDGIGLWSPELFFPILIATSFIILVATIFKIKQLGTDGSKIASLLDGRLINPATNDLIEKRALNVVEEIAIASGVKVPPVYLLEKEKSINAFAAGYSPGSAVIGVSRGCLELLNREELQGVIAHEFSHILNGDMAINIKLIGILHGILFITLAGRVLLRSRHYSRRNSKSGNVLPVIGLALVIIGYLGVFFGQLIKMAISRQREFLADASAVQFTRQTEGIAGALKKNRRTKFHYFLPSSRRSQPYVFC